MRVIKINVVDKTITEIDIRGGYDSMCKELQSNGYDGIRLSANERLWVDDEGLVKDNPIGAFRFADYPQVLSGHGLIIGLDGGGNSVSTKLDVQEITDVIEFVDVSELPPPTIELYSIDNIDDFKKIFNK